jgi:hypothetical protein
MIQHPAVQRICNRDYSSLFTRRRTGKMKA